MVAENIVALISTFSYANLWATLEPLLFFIGGVVIYAVFVFKFYRFVAKKDIFEIDIEKYKPGWTGFFEKVANFLVYMVKYFVVFPAFLFFWFIVLTGLLIFISKSSSIQEIMLISVGLIGAIRVSAYYSEDLSKDLAKMIPFAILGIFLVDTSYFVSVTSFSLISQLPILWRTMAIYLVFIVLLEFVLRSIRTLVLKASNSQNVFK